MTPESVHQFVMEFDWDDDLTPITRIIEDSNTNFATALMIFWRLDGIWFASEAECNAVARELNARVPKNLASGFYSRCNLHYDPIGDNNLSRVRVHKLRGSVESVLLDAV